MTQKTSISEDWEVMITACSACLAPCTPPTASNRATGWATCVAYREPGTHELADRRPNLVPAEVAPWRPQFPHQKLDGDRSASGETAEPAETADLEAGLSKSW